MKRKASLLCLFYLLVFHVLASSVAACMYGPPYKAVCEKYEKADAVIIGIIERIDGSMRENNEQKVKVKVLKTYKGARTKYLTLYQPNSTCGWDFSEFAGQKMLLYIGKDEETKAKSAIGTGFGGPIDQQYGDLAWLDRLPQSKNRTFISGSIALYDDEPFSFSNYLAGVSIEVSNGISGYSLKTDKNGLFELWDVPLGKYSIVPEIPNDYKKRDLELYMGDVEFKQLDKPQVDTEGFKIIINDLKCGGADFVVNKK